MREYTCSAEFDEVWTAVRKGEPVTPSKIHRSESSLFKSHEAALWLSLQSANLLLSPDLLMGLCESNSPAEIHEQSMYRQRECERKEEIIVQFSSSIQENNSTINPNSFFGAQTLNMIFNRMKYVRKSEWCSFSTSLLQRRWFNPELRLLSMWICTCSPCVCLGFFFYPTTQKHCSWSCSIFQRTGHS